MREGRHFRLQFVRSRAGALIATLPSEIAPRQLRAPSLLVLTPHSVRARGYQVLVQEPDGSLVAVEPGPERNLRGVVQGVQGSTVAATLDDDGLRARLVFADGDELWIEPVHGAGRGRHVAYRSEDVVPPDDNGGTDGGGAGDTGDSEPVPPDGQAQLEPEARDDVGDEALGGEAAEEGQEPVGAGAAETLAASEVAVAELAADADHEFFLRYGSVAAVEERINAVVNAVNLQYERDVGIRHIISAIIVRTSEPDPYTATAPDVLMSQLRSQWVNYHAGVKRDTVHLFTGKDMDGSTIGYAYVGAVCTSYAYGVVQSDFSSNFASVTDLSAHELGHNWGADHCACSSPAYTMNPYITSANRFHPTDTIPEIVSFRDSRTCLDTTATPGLPPAAPSGLAATSTTSSTIDLLWSDNASDEDGFRVERSPDGTTWTPVASLGSNTTAYTSIGLAAGTTYHFRVRAVNVYGSSGYSNVASATTTPAQPTRPVAPSGLVASAASTSDIVLSWSDNSTDESGFGLERSADGTTWEAAATTGANVTSYTDAGLLPDTPYYYRVRAFNDAGPSAYSSMASARTQAEAIPAELTGVQILKGSTLGGGALELRSSDNAHLLVKAALKAKKYTTEVAARATSPHSAVSRLDLIVETGADSGGASVSVQLLNLATGRWTTIGSYTQAAVDGQVTYPDISNPQRFVNAASGEIQVRITASATKTQLPAGFTHRIDLVRLDVAP